MKLQGMTKNTAGKRGPKAPGTRAGTLLDWREGSMKSGRLERRLASSVRDGR
ncbi:MAG TPA: hypothetical protein VN844_26385 [Pyrinomonadaceae bacterium]|nr:hypothetical protein [Pyrinomonadaceae bacterium]